MSQEQMEEQVRSLIDNHTLKEGMSEGDACQFAVDVLSSLSTEYEMRLQEVLEEEEDL